MSKTNWAEYICKGAHCKCSDLNCTNYHYGDHTCPNSTPGLRGSGAQRPPISGSNLKDNIEWIISEFGQKILLSTLEGPEIAEKLSGEYFDQATQAIMEELKNVSAEYQAQLEDLAELLVVQPQDGLHQSVYSSSRYTRYPHEYLGLSRGKR